jgi:hypothetical protein
LSQVKLRELLRSPIALLILLPLLPLVLLAALVEGEIRNEEVWEIYEDKETGALKVVVHRRIKRGGASS